MLAVDDIAKTLLEIYSSLPNPLSHVEVLTSWILQMFDKGRTGLVPLQSFKIAISTLSTSWLEEKYRCAFLASRRADSQHSRRASFLTPLVRLAWTD